MDRQAEHHDDADLRQFAHDILQSTTIIQALVAVTRRSIEDRERVESNLDLLEEEARSVAALCQRGLDGGVSATPLDLIEVAMGVVVRMRRTYDGHIEFEREPPQGLLVTGDALDWQRSLINLVENACRAAGPNGKVSVRCCEDADSIRVSVDDSGPGFGAAPAGRSSLGMLAVSRLVDGHSGHIELRRSPLGGAQVTLVIPSRL